MDTEKLTRIVEAVERLGSQRAASKELGMPRSTLGDWLRQARAAGITAPRKIAADGPELSHPSLPFDSLTDEELLDRVQERYLAKHAAWAARKWYRVRVKSNAPLAICWFGDPHIDDDGCDIVSLRRDAEIVADTPGMVGANIGDTTNNWVGRLVAKYEGQHATRSEARQLARWFLLGAGIEWLFVLLGNHDAWRDGAELLQEMCRDLIPLHDWQARIVLQFPNGLEVSI